MKIVILGSGIAGMALGGFLHQKGHQISLNERSPKNQRLGHAFLLHPDAMDILQKLTLTKPNIEIPGQIIDEIKLKKADNELLQCTELESWICMKRSDILSFINHCLPEDTIRFDRSFKNFIYKNNRVVAVEFENGDIEYGDLFVGADGVRSKVRNSLFGEVEFSKTEVREIVGIIKNEEFTQKSLHTFNKINCLQQSIAIGYIPCSNDEMVWYMQYDVRLQKTEFDGPESIKNHCLSLLEQFPEEVRNLLSFNDFSNNFIWQSTDFDLLPSFHKDNVVLIGDAAHVALPFTSAGSTNALIDAYTLSNLLQQNPTISGAFNQFYETRAPRIKEHISLGREIKNNFLDNTNKTVKIPLIQNIKKEEEIPVDFKIEISYFTDPVCSTCWLVQPQLRKLSLKYGDYFEIKYLLGGLLPSWDDLKGKIGRIKQPSDAADYWQEVSETQKMPLSPDVWINSPLSSSFPPSISIKAAQMQNKLKAYQFHRRIKELLFLESKNITDIDLLLHTAEEVGLDVIKLKEDMNLNAIKKFNEDLEYASELKIHTLPTFIFKNEFGDEKTLRGYQEYEVMEKAILELNLLAVKNNTKRQPIELFNIYHSMTAHEFSYLLEINILEADNILINLEHSGIVGKKQNKSGDIWKLKLKN
jgi:2-polyprenyl-6-methoxyphenol hydroxylase-like FAD-dependent oxidoreductase/predicted DsbA family dithiol-disulfide isomerase